MSTGEIDPIEIAKELFPIPEEGYYLSLVVLCIIVPICVSMFYAISDVYRLVKDNPAYDVGNFRYYVVNTYYLVVGCSVATLVNLLYALRKRPEKADVKNIGFWFTMSTLLLFFLLGSRISLLVSLLVITGSDNIINLNPSEVVYIKTKLSYLTLAIVIAFILSTLCFVLINGSQMIDIFTAFKQQTAAAKAEMSN